MKLIDKAMLSSSAVLVLTILHHLYGSILYSTLWRAHVVFFVGPVLLLLAAVWLINRSSKAGIARTLSKWIFVLASATVAVGLIGLFEGGYNHALKNVFYFGGASAETLSLLFPPPTYEMPNDALFEITGVAQFFIAVWSAVHLVGLVRVGRGDSDDITRMNVDRNLGETIRHV